MKPTVVHIITGLKTGGAEQMLARLVARQDTSRFRHQVVCLTDEGPVADQIRSYGIPVHNLRMGRGLPNPITIRRLARMISEMDASVIQTWLYHADLVGGLAARLAKVPVAWGIHHSRLDSSLASRSLRLTVRACAALSSRVPRAIVCCAESSRIAHENHGYEPSRMIVIPNGFDTASFRPDAGAAADMRRELGIGAESRLVGIAGRFVPLKNHQMFVAVSGEIARNNRSVAFVMAGDGLDPGNAELVSWIDSARIPDAVHLLGRRDDMPRVLAALDICVLTSRTEAFPLVIGEAMATGVPCVATDVGDAAYLIADTGRVVPSDDVAGMAAAINELLSLDKSALRDLGELARERMIEHFEIRTVQARYESLWLALMTGQTPCA